MKSPSLFVPSLVVFLLAVPVLAGEPPQESLSLWLRADECGPLDEAGRVAAWKNHAREGGGDATQAEPGRRPLWEEHVAGLGGRPALRFDGKDDFLHLPWLKLGSEVTVILVAEDAEQTEGGSYWRPLLSGDDDSFRDGATKYSFGFRRADMDPLLIANLYYAPKRSHRLMQPQFPPVRRGFHLYHFCRRGAAAEGMMLRVDGAKVARLTADKDPPGFPGTGYTIGQGANVLSGGPSRCYRGRIAEILVYDRPLAAIEILRVEEYLAEKYDLSCEDAPPTGGLALWLDGETLTGTCEPGSAASRWKDQSGHGRDGIQRQPQRCPCYLPHGIKRHPAVDFAGPDAELDFSGWRPPAQAVTFAAVRRAPNHRAEIVEILPGIDPNWGQGASVFRGQLAELLVYDRPLSENEAGTVRRYLRQRYDESADPRCFDNATLIFHNGYNDQPYVVKCRDGSWLCVITTSEIAESGRDRTLVVTRSSDQGRTWTEPAYTIEPGEMRQPSWATLYATPYGRVYVFYNLCEEKPGPAPVGYFFKFSDDNGLTWSQERYRMPIRPLALDRQFDRVGGWSVCPPIQVGEDVLVSYTRFGGSKRSAGQGFVFRSDNLATERDPDRIDWEMLPAGDAGLRADQVPSDMQEEHIITPLADGDLCCLWRTTAGYACRSYSRDGGRTWEAPMPATLGPKGRPVKQPLACCRPYRSADGRYLLWFHNTSPDPGGAIYRPRDVVWLAGGQEVDGEIVWSQPEILLYGHDLPVRGAGMSYPDFVEEDGRLWVTTTDKQNAKIFEVSGSCWRGSGGRKS